MNRRWSILAALTAAIVLASTVGTYHVDADAPEYVYIDADESSPEVQSFLARSDVEYRHGFQGGFSVKLDGKSRQDVKNLGLSTSNVAVYHPNGVPSDPTPYGIEQIYSDTGISQTSGGAGITIGHLDTGIDRNHPDLVGRVVGCKDATGSLALSDAANNTCQDWDGHGTHTAGSAVADGGSTHTGIWGVAPEAGLYSIMVCSSSGCLADDIAAAIDYLGNNNLVNVITMSIGGPSSDSRIAAAIDRHKGSILFVASAGNTGPARGSIEYPAWDPNVIAVAAIDNAESVTNFSSRGVDDGDDSVVSIGEIEFAAAGKIVESTFPTAIEPSGYAYYSGTSMAAPQVAGLAAKLWQGDPNSTRTYLRTTATDITSGRGAGVGYDVASGYGLPHVGTASPPPPTSDPVLTSIDVSPANKTIEKGKSQQYKAVANYDDGSFVNVTSSVNWDSSDTAVATVDDTGMANGVEEGTANIVALMDGVISNNATLTVSSAPPVVLKLMHVGDIDVSIKQGRRGRWEAYVTVLVHDSGEVAVNRARVEVTWTTPDGTDTDSCRVKLDGTCRFRSDRFDDGVAGVTFQVTGVGHKTYTYDQDDNHDPDADSDGTTMVIFKP